MKIGMNGGMIALALAGALAATPALAASTAGSALDSAADAVGQAAERAANKVDQTVGATNSVTAAEIAKGIPAAQVSNPAQTLATAEVKTHAGKAVGDVDSVLVNGSGKAKAIRLNIGGFLGIGSREVDVAADRFVYIPDRHILVTDLTEDEAKTIPAIN